MCLIALDKGELAAFRIPVERVNMVWLQSPKTSVRSHVFPLTRMKQPMSREH